MSRSGYSEDLDNWDLIRWRGQVASAIRGKRGQAFLRELIVALEAMPSKRLIQHELKQADGEVCALGAVGVNRGMPVETLDPYDYEGIAEDFGIAHQLVQEIEFINDEHGHNPEARWRYVHAWATAQLAPSKPRDGSE